MISISVLPYSIHETEIKMVKSKWSYKNSWLKYETEMNYEGQVKTNYEGRNRLRGSKRITRVEMNYEGRNEL